MRFINSVLNVCHFDCTTVAGCVNVGSLNFRVNHNDWKTVVASNATDCPKSPVMLVLSNVL